MPENMTDALGQLRVTQKLNEYEFGVEIWLMNDAPTKNRWTFENLDEHYKTFAGQPILCAYRHNGDVGDGHNMEIRRDPKTGERYYSFVGGTAERIVGVISDTPGDIWLAQEGDVKWIVAKGRIFAFYAKELVDKIIETGTMDVSVETDVAESYKDDAGWEFMTAWTGLAVTILGDGVAPAIPGANIAALAELQEDFEELKLRAASLREGIDPNAEDNINSDKGVNKRMNVFNKTQIAALAEKFTGWIVVCAAKDDDGIHVGLRDENGAFGRYTMASEAETFAPERVEKIAVMADFGNGLTCDVGEITDHLIAENAANAALLESTVADNAAKDATIAELRENEAKRCVEDCRRTASETLDAFNANREDRVDASVLDAVFSDIENGVVANSADVEIRVKALCADAVAAQDKANAERSRRSFIWENAARKEAASDDGSLKSLLSRYNIE